MAKLLLGVKILDLTNVLTGPFCSSQLAQLGAEVIKIEIPKTGDLARKFGTDASLSKKLMGTGYLSQNAGKKSITLDLKSAEGKTILRRLVAQSDVLLENNRPQVMERLGLGYEALKEINPRLIFCSITGFGQDGPLSGNPAYDQIIQGLSGSMSLTGDENSGPLRVGWPAADTIGGLTAAFAVTAALYRRSVSGEGERIDVSLLEAMMSAMAWGITNFLLTGKEPTRSGNINTTASPSGAFKTKDGMLNISANKDSQFTELCRTLGRPDLLADRRFSTREARMENRPALMTEIERELASRPAVEWEEIFNRVGVPAGRLMSVPDILAHPQIETRKFLTTLEDVPGIDRSITNVRSGFRLASGDPGVTTPPPRLGQDNAEILGGLGYDADDLARLASQGIV